VHLVDDSTVYLKLSYALGDSKHCVTHFIAMLALNWTHNISEVCLKWDFFTFTLVLFLVFNCGFCFGSVFYGNEDWTQGLVYVQWVFYLLSYTISHVWFLFLRYGLPNFAWTSLKIWSSSLYLLSSWDYRPAPPPLANFFGGGHIIIEV
jgi:hypothetical protein